MDAAISKSTSAMAKPQRSEDATAHGTYTNSSPPVILIESNISNTLIEEQSDLNGAGTPDVNQTLLFSTQAVDSGVSFSTTTPLANPHGRNIQGWTNRYIYRWRSPFLMVLFFVLGAAVSIAHCVFYPMLNGKIVGGSDQQEEKIR